jgi:hypothetical protein
MPEYEKRRSIAERRFLILPPETGKVVDERSMDDRVCLLGSCTQTREILKRRTVNRYTRVAQNACAPASLRAMPSTLWPEAINSLTTADPINPVAPVTKTRISIKLLREWNR